MITRKESLPLDIDGFAKALADAGISVADDDLASAFETAQWLSCGLEDLAQAYPDLSQLKNDGRREPG